MKATLEPILRDCRAIYTLDGVMERYWAYVNLMTKDKGEFLPLGAFSPMGKRQGAFLDELIALEAEAWAQKLCHQVTTELESTEPRNLSLRFPGQTQP